MHGMDPEVLQRIGPAMQAYVDTGGYAGINVMIADRDGPVFAGCFGQRDIEAVQAMSPDTIFRIYSMTKPVTAVALMTLFDEGRVALTDPVAEHLPAFAAVKVLGPSGRLDEPVRPLLISDLLTHTGGFTNELQDTPVAALYRDIRLHNDATRSLAEFVDEVARLPLAFQPGTRWHYGTGLDVAARVVEVVTGQPFGSVLRDRIFDPLGMTDTAFGVPAGSLDRLAAMYGLPDVFAAGLTTNAIATAAAAGANERRDVGATHPADTPDVFVRGGFGLFSTAGDYLRFARMLLNGGELDGHRVLAGPTVELMYRNHLPAALLPFETAPGASANGRGFGLGSQVVLDAEAIGGVGSIGEHGWPGAAKTTFWVDPIRGATGVLMAQYMLGWTAPEDDVRALVHEALGPA